MEISWGRALWRNFLGEIWHRMQKNLPGDLAIQGR
jgi:Na+/H+ antiporter NhaB